MRGVMVRVKVITGVILVTLALAIGYGYFINPNPVQTNGHKKQKVTLIVVFQPSRLSYDDPENVIAKILIDHVDKNPGWDRVRISPWVTQVTVTRGQLVQLKASRSRIKTLTCQIMVDNEIVDEEMREGGGQVSCEHQVPFG